MNFIRAHVLALVILVFFAFLLLASPVHAQVTFPNRGGTGTGVPPTIGQVLVGQSNGTYAPVATSSLGISGGGTSLATSSWDYWLTTKTTSALAEGANLYYTIGRAQASLTAGYDAAFARSTSTAATSTSLAVTGSFNFLGTTITNVATWFSGLFDTRLATKSTSDLAEGSNRYFTNGRADGRISATSSIGTLISAPNLSTVNTTLTGLLKASSGTLTVATDGTDYQVPLTFAYPLTNAANTISLAFGTTTSNVWGGTQTFANAPVFASLTGSRLIALDASDIATTTITLANVVNSISDVSGSTGTGNIVLSAGPTFTGNTNVATLIASAAVQVNNGQVRGGSAATSNLIVQGTSSNSPTNATLTLSAATGLATAPGMRFTTTGIGVGTTTSNTIFSIFGGGLGLNPGSATIPTCTVATRGMIWNTFSGAGVADLTQICRKNAADAYAWITI